MEKTIFFDYDGTIHQTFSIYKPALKKAIKYLNEMGYPSFTVPSDEIISGYIGMSPKEMWGEFAKSIDLNVREDASAIVSKEMEQQILRNQAKWYKHSKEVLIYLKSKGFSLVLVSNCKIYYMEAHKKSFKLCNYFDECIASEAYNFIRKSEIIKELIQNHSNAIAIVGDRYVDIEAGIENNLITVGATYGYGSKEELKPSDHLIKDVIDLIDISKKYFE